MTQLNKKFFCLSPDFFMLWLSIKMLNLFNAYRFCRKVTSHDIRLKVPTKQSCQQNDQERKKEREGEGRDGRKIRGGQHRYFVSLLLYFVFYLPLLPLAISYSLFPTCSRLGIWFPCAKARHYGELPRRTRIKDSFEVIRRGNLFILLTFFVF